MCFVLGRVILSVDKKELIFHNLKLILIQLELILIGTICSGCFAGFAGFRLASITIKNVIDAANKRIG